MKNLILTLCIAALVVSCRKLPTDPADAPPLRYIGRDTNQYGIMVYTLELNTTRLDKDLEYSAYSADSPLYQFRFLKDGSWINGGAGWCGNGANRFSLASQPERFRLHMSPFSDTPRPWKGGLTLWQPGEYKFEDRIELWSDEINE